MDYSIFLVFSSSSDFIFENVLHHTWSALHMKCLLVFLFFVFLLKLFQVYPEGKMSQHFASLKPGDVVEVKG
jgi:hypothetical protein